MRIDRVTRQRLVFMSGVAMRRAAAAVVVVLGPAFIPLDIVPFVSEDGLLVLLGTLGVPVTLVPIAMVF